MDTKEAVAILIAKGHKFGTQYVTADGKNFFVIDDVAVHISRLSDLATGRITLEELKDGDSDLK